MNPHGVWATVAGVSLPAAYLTSGHCAHHLAHQLRRASSRRSNL